MKTLGVLGSILSLVGSTAGAGVVDFESVVTGTPVNGLAVDGASFTASSLDAFWGDPTVVAESAVYNYVAGHYLIGTTAPGNWLGITFDAPVTGLGFGFSGPTALPFDMTAHVTLYDALGTLIGSESFVSDTITNNQNGGPAFIFEGWADLSSYAGVGRLDVVFSFDSPNTATYKFDNLTFTPVPGPASVAALVGLLASGGRRRTA